MSDDSHEPPGGGEQRPTNNPSDEPALGYAWSADHRSRGGCLTAFLVLTMIASPMVGIVYVLAQDLVRNQMPHALAWTFPVLALLALANFVCAIGVWKWKKWGVIGALSNAALMLLVYFVNGVPPLNALFSLVGPAILIFLVRPLWRGFE